MADRQPLRGSCHCGRNQYIIQLPEDVSDHADIYFDSSRDSRTSPIHIHLQKAMKRHS
jgi:hypothetical protein